jgi:hypothetical protein
MASGRKPRGAKRSAKRARVAGLTGSDPLKAIRQVESSSWSSSASLIRSIQLWKAKFGPADKVAP